MIGPAGFMQAPREQPADTTTYRTFKRSANNWEEFSKAKKTTVHTGLSFDEARQVCQTFNKNRTAKQKKRGTVMEFIREDRDG